MKSSTKETLNRTLLAYVGAAIGICSQLWIYPLAFDVYGEIQFVLSVIMFIVPFASLGVIDVTTRFFPYFQGKDDNGYLGVLLLVSAISYMLFFIGTYMFQRTFYSLLTMLNFDVNLFERSSILIAVSVLLVILIRIMGSYLVNYKKITVPYLLSDFSWKIITPLIVLAYFFSLATLEDALKSIAIAFALIFLTYLLYLKRLKLIRLGPLISKPLKANYKSMIKFSLYGVVANLGSILAFSIDKIMLRGLSGAYDTGIYSSFIVLSGLILFPYDSYLSIKLPEISNAWKYNDISRLKEINYKATNLLLFIGTYIFLLFLLNIDDVLKITSNYDQFRLGIEAFMFLGVAKAIDSSFSVNGLILGFSRFYYTGIFATLILAAVNIALNINLIPKIGMTGAAVATCVSILLYNLFYYFFNWFKFGIQGFDVASLKIIITLAVSYLVVNNILAAPPLLNILFRTLAFVALSLPIIYYLNLVPDINIRLQKILSRLKP